MLVHVINKDGQPLMPCSPRKARLLMKAGKAKPCKGKTGCFTIQLFHGSSGYKQPVTVGVDTGAKRVPIAAISQGKVLYVKEIILRTDVKKQLSDRRRYRRNRRNRLRYRKPRFDNRVKTKCSRCGVNNVPKKEKGKAGRAMLCRPCQGRKGHGRKPHILPPSVKNRADSILRDIDNLSLSLPIDKIIVETASFDTQKMANPDIQGEEYQRGTLFGCEIWNYLINKFGNKCAYCKGVSGDPKLELEHVYPQSKGGTDKVSNLVVACRTCNQDKSSTTLEQWVAKLKAHSASKLRDMRLKNIPKIRDRSHFKKGFQYSALTQSYKNYLLEELRASYLVSETTGAHTKYRRGVLRLSKSQINDVLAIASDGGVLRLPNDYILEKIIKKRRPAEYISPCKKGTSIVKRKWESEVFGFRLWDKVLCSHPKLGRVVGRVTTMRQGGSFRIGSSNTPNILAKMLGKQDAGISYKKLILLKEQRSNYVRDQVRVSLTPLAVVKRYCSVTSTAS